VQCAGATALIDSNRDSFAPDPHAIRSTPWCSPSLGLIPSRSAAIATIARLLPRSSKCFEISLDHRPVDSR
jgi:hypothetical protein